MGPLQYVFLGVRGQEQQDAVVRTLRGLSERGAIRIIDVVYATKREDGTLVPGRATSLTGEERERYGAVAGALVGFGYGGMDGARTGAEMGMRRAETPFTEREFGETVFGESAQEIREHLKDAAEDLPTGAVLRHRVDRASLGPPAQGGPAQAGDSVPRDGIDPPALAGDAGGDPGPGRGGVRDARVGPQRAYAWVRPMRG